MTRLLLASGSPSRLRILREAGIEPLVAVPDVDEDALEDAHPDADVRTLVTLLAQAKAQAVIERLTTDSSDPIVVDTVEREMVIVACDSVLELGSRAVGKPHTAERTRTVWQQMGGRPRSCGVPTGWVSSPARNRTRPPPGGCALTAPPQAKRSSTWPRPLRRSWRTTSRRRSRSRWQAH